MIPRRGIWTLSTPAWLAIFAIAVSALGSLVGLSAARADGAAQAAGGLAGGGPTTGGEVPQAGQQATALDGAIELSIVPPPLLGALAIDVLGLLEVRAPDQGQDYQRTQHFGEAWLDVDGNGCSTREDILLRDLNDTVLNGCKVMSGTVVDPYSGQTINFVRGNDTSMLVQIDHIVALHNAWATGAQQLSPEDRQRLANDPTNLLAVSEATNQSKGSGDAVAWLPPFAEIHCEYAARQVSVKYAYHLWVTPSEYEALERVLRSCPDQPAYRSSLGEPASPIGLVGPPAGEDTTGTGGPVYYENCSAAYAAGVSRIPRGAPGYRPELDRDNDGIACEGY